MNKKAKTIIFIIIIIILLGIAGFSAYMIIDISSEYNEAVYEYEQILQEVEIEEVLEENLKHFDWRENYEPKKIQNLNFDGLSALNDEVVAWIVNPNTVINYPVTQHTDNSYYLKRTFAKEWNSSGCIFIDYRNAKDFSDFNTIMLGHHMKNGSMFASICEYRNQEYYEEHPAMLLYTPECVYKLEVFASYIDSHDGDYYQIRFGNDEEKEDYLQYISRNNLISTDVEVGINDRIVTLQTCTYEFDNARFVVHCKLVPIN